LFTNSTAAFNFAIVKQMVIKLKSFFMFFIF
jgi:hypothetical protein